MAIGDLEIYDNAGRLLRAVPEPDWQAIEPAVLAAVRATPRGGWPLTVVDPEPDAASGRIRVSDLVLTAALSRALAGEPDCFVDRIEATSNDEVLQGVQIQLSGLYGADLVTVTERVRQRAESVLSDVIGPGTAVPISVTVVDVHR
ncbi:hypothetical protein [Mycolicibacterium aichiense]|uniref:Uncharacterized protein n=1 Tax=Mycolicibacterium aichiense TaxID=1799 RepID=A0AAD1MFX6_9MYCO|nr:hypothetical protein [Mycolicibacterium aichiense]MCV7016939.1 hypothetical protein [Mycolicibacterium aichiense]BBX10639.1 hypothetical protein MAIC_54420 [Mycolicibacterium aichiense]STZ25704.1 Uncharacterised protein [Mycolicibacterium aichiense]